MLEQHFPINEYCPDCHAPLFRKRGRYIQRSILTKTPDEIKQFVVEAAQAIHGIDEAPAGAWVTVLNGKPMWFDDDVWMREMTPYAEARQTKKGR